MQLEGLDVLNPGVRGVPVGPVAGIVPLPVAPGVEVVKVVASALVVPRNCPTAVAPGIADVSLPSTCSR